MNFLLNNFFRRRPKPLTSMSRSELRRQELLLEKDRTQLLNRISKLAKEKAVLFERGAKEPTPEIRRTMAQEFELRTTEQLMISRQLNLRSKEIITVSRMRMLRENADRVGLSGGRLGMIRETDMLKLERLIENDAVKAEAYQQRLDELLRVGAAADEGSTGLSEAGKAVLEVWEKLDRGAIAGGTSEAFAEADRRVREKQSAAEG